MTDRKRFNFPADGKWDIVSGAEEAGVVDEQIRAEGECERLRVRHHPWTPPGMIIAIRDEPIEGDWLWRLKQDGGNLNG